MVLRLFKMIGTSGFLAALECTKFVFGRGSAPDHAGGAYSAPPDSLAGLRGLFSKGKRREGRGEMDGEGTGRGEEGRRGTLPLTHIHGSALEKTKSHQFASVSYCQSDLVKRS